MKNFVRIQKKQLIYNAAALLIGVFSLLLGASVYYVNNYIAAILMVTFSVALYFFIVLMTAERNWLDITACFSLVWILTIGLSALRLTDYQKEWSVLTWVIVTVSYAMFYLGAFLGKEITKANHEKINSKKISVKSWTLRRQDNRLFWICFTVTVIGIICFVANVAIKGFIPYFSSSTTAYTDFYTKFYIFITAESMISGLCYYTLVKQKLHWWKKAFLIFSILYSTFLIPTLVVSRGMFLTAALSLMAMIFYLHKKKFVILCLSLIVIFGFYAIGTQGRGYTSAQLDEFFEPSKIEITTPNPDDTNSENSENPENPQGNVKTFQLSGKLAFVYTYLTVSHDNLNEAVLYNKSYTYGLRQFAPFNTIFRIGWVNTKIENAQTYLVRPHLNTVNLIGDAYYDFGVFGVAISTFIWAFAFGVIQVWATKGDKPFGLLALGNTLTPVILCFFASWMSVFSHWMHWGVILIMFFVATITKDKNRKEEQKTEAAAKIEDEQKSKITQEELQ